MERIYQEKKNRKKLEQELMEKNETNYSRTKNKWHECPPMSVGRASPAVAAANSRLYVIGGDQINEANDFYRAQVTISHVEAYDPQIDSWIDCAPLPESRSESGAVVI
ncbi:hypothetical protein Anas_06267 [Armadillidium nasatum]|uniref:Uncharacterized protein n=1 Tax=Armadillidium nasatum TaxID=96803 RepID=A0A5N5SZC9_9CRUS|nr:hypothetical protein Anas_06267 [Armadillidium nasatum]